MDEGQQINAEIDRLYFAQDSNNRSKKYIGAASVEIIRKRLADLNLGFNTSMRDVFIKDLVNEIDLLILKKGVDPTKVSYAPSEVLALVEVKTVGSFGKSANEIVYNLVDKAKKYGLPVFYITVWEKEASLSRVTEKDNLRVFEFTLKQKGVKEPITGGGWTKLINEMKELYTK